VADLAAALAAVLDDERERAEMVRRGLERAQAYTWTRSAEMVAQAFAELLARAR
jgi:glycosyltransferase involved in cell wall biosynthesis